MSDLNEKVNNYLKSIKKMTHFKNEIKELRKSIKEDESFFKEYLETNNLNTLSTDNGEIFLHEKKSNQNLNKETITSALREKIQNETIINDVTDSLFKISKIEVVVKSKTKNI